MKYINKSSYTSNILSSIISLIIGVVIFTRPDLVIILLSYVLGAILLAYSYFRIIYYSFHKGKDPNYPLNDLIWALICMIIGLICIFLSEAVEQAVRFLIGGWILAMGINRFVNALHMPNKSASSFASVIIVSILLMAVGLYVIFVSNLIIASLGIILIIYSILEITNYILVSKDIKEYDFEEKKTNEKKQEVQVIETEEVKEKEPKIKEEPVPAKKKKKRKKKKKTKTAEKKEAN